MNGCFWVVLPTAAAPSSAVAGTIALNKTWATDVGTAITVSVLAILAVQARHWAGRIAGSQGGSLAWARAGQGVALAGGLLIFALGVSLLGAGFDAPAHPLGL